MFGLGFFEILVILAGILIFIRPQDLPAFVYRVGKVYGQIKEIYTKFWREANLIKNQIDDMVEKENSAESVAKNSIKESEKSKSTQETKTIPFASPINSPNAKNLTTQKNKNGKTSNKTTKSAKPKSAKETTISSTHKSSNNKKKRPTTTKVYKVKKTLPSKKSEK